MAVLLLGGPRCLTLPFSSPTAQSCPQHPERRGGEDSPQISFPKVYSAFLSEVCFTCFLRELEGCYDTWVILEFTKKLESWVGGKKEIQLQ